MSRHPSKVDIAATLTWLDENSRDNDIDITPKRPRCEVWRSSELEAAMRRPSRQWPSPHAGKLIWRHKEKLKP